MKTPLVQGREIKTKIKCCKPKGAIGKHNSKVQRIKVKRIKVGFVIASLLAITYSRI